jgi:uroporphyrinogen-III synthase
MAFAVLTRASIEAYAPGLAALGLEAVSMPVTRTIPPDDPDALARAVASGFTAVVVTSARGAEALARAAAGRPLPEVWAVGEETRRVLATSGIAAHHPDGVRDGDELVRALLASRAMRGCRVLVPRAAEGRVEPAALLRAAGVEVVDVVAYQTVAAAASDRAVVRGVQLLVTRGAPVCAVFAPSQVAALAEIVGELAAIDTAFCAIGETTAVALRAAAVARLAVAPEPTPAGMAHAARAVYPAR